VSKSKTSSGVRRVPIAKKTLPLWVSIRSERETPPQTSADSRYSAYSANLTRLCSTLGIDAHKPHDTRHTTATLLRLAGVDPLVTKRILGHSTADLTERVYTHIPDETLLTAIDKI
jgi:integrase